MAERLAAPKQLPDRKRRAALSSRQTWIGVAVGLSLALHAIFLVGVLVPLHLKPKEPPPPATVELVMVEQQGSGKDQAPPTPPPQPPAPPTPPQPQSPPVPPTPPEPPAPPRPATPEPPQPPPPPPRDEEPVPAPTPPPPPPVSPPPAPPPSPPPRPEATPSPELNLGGTDSPSNATVVNSLNVIPAGPDARYHNIEPVYPPEAARRGEQGNVALLVHVTAQGVPRSIDIVQSSGFRLLDNAARDAVLAWHFNPAMRDGQPIDSDFPLQVRFRVDQ